MSQFGSSSNTSNGFNEAKSPGGNGVSMDTAKTMRGGTNTDVPQGDPKYKSANTGQNDATKMANTKDKMSNIGKLNGMDKTEFGGKTARPL